MEASEISSETSNETASETTSEISSEESNDESMSVEEESVSQTSQTETTLDRIRNGGKIPQETCSIFKMYNSHRKY